MTWIRRLLACLILGITACGGSSSDDTGSRAGNSTVQDGNARFQVLSPTLIRLEYADDGQFEDGPTQTVAERPKAAAPFSTTFENGERIIRTSRLTLRYRQNSGPFAPQNLSVELSAGGNAITAQPDWMTSPDNLGGWQRGLDNKQDPVPLHDGLLSRTGWYLLDDTQTVLLTGEAPGFRVRPGRSGSYQDGYFFGYGHDYVQGLADLRLLTGAAPLLPRKAFGVWFSRYWAYSEAELRDLVAQFRAHNVPLDTLSIDTDWKRVHNPVGCIIFSAVAGARPGDPCSWNGWDWNRDLFPDPAGFLAWLRQQGIQVALNIHPSISSADPEFAETQAISGGLETDGSTPPCFLFQADISACHVFDWTNAKHLEAYFALHAPLADGVDFWWLDWCCDGSSAVAPGLTADTWINAHYAREQAARGSRWPVFSRIGASFQEGAAGIANNGAGAFAEHRYTLHFTGDTCGTWQMLAFEAEMTAAEGNIGLPYVTHDIGSFLGPPTTTGCNGVLGHTSHLPDDMYVRWVQFGTFQPLDRLHSHHGDRLPWEYPGQAELVASEFLRLRERLIPHLYTLSREAHDSGLPMVRALYLQWPELDAAYEHRGEYTLGKDLLVATVAAPGDPASVEVWIPPGAWFDYFTGESFTGPAVATRSVPLGRYPVFMRAGAILPTQPDLLTSSSGPQDNLVLNVWPGGSGEYELYEDEGQGFGYRNGAFSRTRIESGSTAAGCRTLAIGAARGSFPGRLATRAWTVRLVGLPAPAVVQAGGQPLPASSWSYDATTQTLTLDTGPRATASPLGIVAGPAGCA
jgi:hypothetical protein